MKTRFFDRSSQDYVYFGDKKVEIPKLTVRKWKALFQTIETLPQTIVSVLSAKGSDSFTAAVVVGTEMAFDEVVRMISIVTEIDEEWIEENVGLTELMDFIEKTAKKNDLSTAVKKFRAVLGKLTASSGGKDEE